MATEDRIDWEHVFRRAKARRLDCLVAAAWPGTLGELARLLGCDRVTAARAGLCYRPSPACPPELWTHRVATAFGLDPRRVARLTYVIT